MIGQTNSQVGGGIRGEKVSINLLTNQSEHSDLMGAIVTVKYADNETQYAWEGYGITVSIPPYVDYEISVSDVEGYATPEKFTATAVTDNIRTLMFTYNAEKVKVSVSASDGTDMTGTSVTVDEKEYTFTGDVLEVLVPFGKEYTIVGGEKEGLSAPIAQTFTASQQIREVSLVYRSSVLTLHILSNQANDATIAAVRATVSYGGVDVSVANGQSIDIPSDAEITVTFPEVENYKTPSPITFTHSSGLVEKTGTYTTELVTVNASADDGASVDGVTASVVRYKATTLNPSNGIYIQDIEGFLYTKEQWDGSKTPNGIAVVTDNCSYVIALECQEYYWSTQNTVVSGILTTTNKATATTDLKGSENTVTILNSLGDNAPAANYCANYTFPNGQKGYLGSAGEWEELYSNFGRDNVLLPYTQLLGVGTIQYAHQTSTQYDNESIWCTYPQEGSYNYLTKTTVTFNTRPFTTLEAVIIQPTDPEEKTITDGKAQFKVAHGLEYDVTMSDKDGYKTPASQSFTADSVSRSVSMVYAAYTDLSRQDVHGNHVAQHTANCYVVKEAGDYMFPIAYGAAIKNDAVNTEAFTNNGGANSHDFVNYKGNVITSPYIETDTATEAVSVQISIADTDNALIDLGIIGGEDCRYVKFKVESVPTTGGNVVVSVMDASGVIMWNWHIWLWTDDLTPVSIVNATNVTYDILPVNLGSKWDDDAHTYIKNWFYQFGRPVPMLCPKAYNSTTSHGSYGNLAYGSESIASNLQEGIKKPTTLFIYDTGQYKNWFSTNSGKNYNLWDASFTTAGNSDKDVKKTVYDPCPIGFRMPNANTFTYFSTTNVVGSFASGWKFKRYSNDSVGVFFPASGYRNESAGSLINTGSNGYVWTSGSYSQTEAYYLRYNSTSVTPLNHNSRACCFSVRPIKDDELALPTHKVTVNVTGDTQTPTGYTVSIHKVVDVIDETTGEVTETLGDVLFTQITASATHEIAWGVKYAVVCSDVDGFATPANQMFAADSNSRTVEIRYIYHSGTTTPTNGVWIQDTDGYCHTVDEWTGEYTANGIAVVTSNCSFVMALSNAHTDYCQWGSSGTTVNNIVTTSSGTTAKTDYKGESNTTTILNQLGNSSSTSDAPAAYYCRAFTFPNGKAGYLGAAGEWQAALDNKSAIATILSKVGGTAMSDYYWTSTQYSSDTSWCMTWAYESLYYSGKSGSSYYVRAFAAI